MWSSYNVMITLFERRELSFLKSIFEIPVAIYKYTKSFNIWEKHALDQ